MNIIQNILSLNTDDRNIVNNRISAAVCALTMIVFLAGCGGGTVIDGLSKEADMAEKVSKVKESKEEADTADVKGNGGSMADNKIKDVVIRTTVRKTGQYPESISAVYTGTIDAESYDPADFSMTGMASIWGSNNKRKFEAGFSKIEVNDNTLTLYPKDFPEKFFYVDEFRVECSKNPGLDFTYDDVSKVVTPVADDFEYIEGSNGSPFNYNLFTPADEKDQPLVIVFHGYGDTSNLRTYRTAVDWAEPDNQKKRPCYVIAPVIDDMDYFREEIRDEIFEELKKLTDTMVSEGKVDKSRIYVMGNSFGGMSTIEFCEKYPGTVAGALALCPAMNYSDRAVRDLVRMKDTPLWIAHAEHDKTIPSSESLKINESLTSAGAREVKLTIYSDDEMNAVGGDPAPDATYSYHHVELAVMEDEAYKEWLYSHTL